MDKMNVISLGNIMYSDRCEMPQIEVMANGKVVGYLAPFRHYCFQISRTIDGEGSMGSSPIIKLDEVINNNSRESALVILKGLAMLALTQISKSFLYHINVGSLMIVDNGEEEVWYADKLEMYIDKVYTYLFQKA